MAVKEPGSAPDLTTLRRIVIGAEIHCKMHYHSDCVIISIWHERLMKCYFEEYILFGILITGEILSFDSKYSK